MSLSFPTTAYLGPLWGGSPSRRRPPGQRFPAPQGADQGVGSQAWRPAPVCPAWADSMKLKRTSRSRWLATVAEPQGVSREAKLKEAAGKTSTGRTGSGREAGRGRRAGWEQRSPKTTQTRQVEPPGARGQNQRLTWGDLFPERGGEVSRGRSSEEGGVMLLERRAEGAAQSIRKAWNPKGRRDLEVVGTTTTVVSRHAGTRLGGGAAPSGCRRFPSARRFCGLSASRHCGTVLRTAAPTVVSGKPDVRWCGRVPGRNPRHPTRSPVRADDTTAGVRS